MSRHTDNSGPTERATGWPRNAARSGGDDRGHAAHHPLAVKIGTRSGIALGSVARLAAIGALRRDVDPDTATASCDVRMSHETFRGLVTAGSTLPAYKAWLLATLTQQLLRPGKLPRTATSGLSFDNLLARS